MSISNTLARVVLEPESQAFVEATAAPPFLYELTPDEARKVCLLYTSDAADEL